jgi:hypothetical protein
MQWLTSSFPKFHNLNNYTGNSSHWWGKCNIVTNFNSWCVTTYTTHQCHCHMQPCTSLPTGCTYTSQQKPQLCAVGVYKGSVTGQSPRFDSRTRQSKGWEIKPVMRQGQFMFNLGRGRVLVLLCSLAPACVRMRLLNCNCLPVLRLCSLLGQPPLWLRIEMFMLYESCC